MFADLSQSLEGGDSILVGLRCMDLGKEQHEEHEEQKQEQEERHFLLRRCHPLFLSLVVVISKLIERKRKIDEID